MRSEVWSELVEQGRLLVRMGRLLTHRHVEIYEGVGPTLGGMLATLSKEGPMRLTALADRLQVDPSVASRQASELVERGLVERRPDPDDARAGLLDVTAEGHATLRRAMERSTEVMASALADWSDAEARQLVDLLTKLNTDLREDLCGEKGRV
ncbi:MarR family winged helix-turn-helix transcriptional regulator [Jiangella mangrovi]|uniref:DNA-binding MarR family transcriptional regulator n=1 Tax=Jiangella mangrovi TaxID=1524084 RepID=A0A7W9LN31_9ACTN|nr:MarR family transcriptional regulator [Jiangella mangrovi]MBB5789881.1 DNA-binding MarR family transcriptional regulator [Jiangella mangrovi]